MEAKLIVVGGDAKTAEIKLKLPTIIGRGRGATVTLPHPLVSRQHCEIYEADGSLFVRDLGSLNGTFIGNEPITEAPLPAGELLTVGAVTFRAIYGELLEREKREREQARSAPRRSGQSPTKTARDQSVETLAEPHSRTLKSPPPEAGGPSTARPPHRPGRRAGPQEETAWAADTSPDKPPPPRSLNLPLEIAPSDVADVDEEAVLDAEVAEEEAHLLMLDEGANEASRSIEAQEIDARGLGSAFGEASEVSIEAEEIFPDASTADSTPSTPAEWKAALAQTSAGSDAAAPLDPLDRNAAKKTPQDFPLASPPRGGKPAPGAAPPDRRWKPQEPTPAAETPPAGQPAAPSAPPAASAGANPAEDEQLQAFLRSLK